MGVKGLWKIIRSCGEQETPQNLTLAVDTSIWVHQYKGMGESDAVYLISKKIIKLLFHNIRPVFIFDGTANPLKRKVIEERKKDKLEGLVKDIINNVQCRKCKISVRTCIHGGLLKDDFKEGDLMGNIKWGNIYSEESLPKNNKQEIARIDDISNFIESKSHSNAQKLKMLVKMRERRKDRFSINETTMADFSKSQIKNIKNRNLVSFYIKKLETDQTRKINSDCTKSFVFLKNNTSNTDVRHENENSSSTELNDFLEVDNDLPYKSELGKIKDLKDLSHQRDKLRFSVLEQNYEKHDITRGLKVPENNIVYCTTNNEKYNDGYFGQIDNYEDVKEEDKIDFDFSKSRTVKFSNKSAENFEPMDFLSIQSIIKDILKAFDLPFLDSPSESDAQCGFLYKTGVVDGVITEDNDILLHGGVVYKNFFRKNKSIIKYDPKIIEELLGFTTNDLINLSYVLGSDYTVGLKGIGIKKAGEYIKSDEFKALNIDSYKSVYLNCPIREDWRPKFQTVEMEKVLKFWKSNGMVKEKVDELNFYLKNKKG